MRIVIITCYFDPDYVRARSLRAALQTLPNVEVTVLKNTHHGLLRYPEVIWKLWRAQRRERPAAYLLTFRGQEILPFVLSIAGRTPVWFDEFIVPIAYATNEKHRRSPAIVIKHFLARISLPLYNRWLRHCASILADTQSHAQLSARVSHQSVERYRAIPVGTDETLFYPALKPSKNNTFQVFYYATMLPLHGIKYVLQAAELLGDDPDITFVISGGKQVVASLAEESIARGARIQYHDWIPFETLLTTIHQSAVCLGGPFGDTAQAQHVVTGKTYQFLAAEVPVVVGASPAASEYFTDKLNALVVPQADPEALASAIRWAKAHPERLALVASAGRKLYETEFSTPAIARRLRPLIDEVS